MVHLSSFHIHIVRPQRPDTTPPPLSPPVYHPGAAVPADVRASYAPGPDPQGAADGGGGGPPRAGRGFDQGLLGRGRLGGEGASSCLSSSSSSSSSSSVSSSVLKALRAALAGEGLLARAVDAIKDYWDVDDSAVRGRSRHHHHHHHHHQYHHRSSRRCGPHWRGRACSRGPWIRSRTTGTWTTRR
jgi:hypothetical protein